MLLECQTQFCLWKLKTLISVFWLNRACSCSKVSLHEFLSFNSRTDFAEYTGEIDGVRCCNSDDREHNSQLFVRFYHKIEFLFNQILHIYLTWYLFSYIYISSKPLFIFANYNVSGGLALVRFWWNIFFFFFWNTGFDGI